MCPTLGVWPAGSAVVTEAARLLVVPLDLDVLWREGIGLCQNTAHLWLEAFDTLPVSDRTVASLEPVAAHESAAELQPEIRASW